MPYIPLIEQTTIVFSYLPFPDDIILDKKHALTVLFQKKPLEYEKKIVTLLSNLTQDGNIWIFQQKQERDP